MADSTTDIKPTTGGSDSVPVSILTIGGAYETGDFNLEKALAGNLVGYKDSDSNIHVGILVKTGNVTSVGELIYSMKEGGNILLFTGDGKCISTGYESIQLSMYNAKSLKYSGGKVTRGSSETSALVNTITPLDSFAISILQGMLPELPKPEEMSQANMIAMANIAYQWATAMFTVASSYRTTNDTATDAASTSLNAALDSVKKSLDSLTTAVKSNGSTSDSGSTGIVGKLTDIYNALTNVNSTITTKDMGGTVPDNLKVTLSDTVKVDNPTDDKFAVSGAGGIDYDGLNDVGSNISAVPVFNDKALGRVTIAALASKIIELDTKLAWLRKDDNAEDKIWNAHAQYIGDAVAQTIDEHIADAQKQLIADYGLTKKTS